MTNDTSLVNNASIREALERKLLAIGGHTVVLMPDLDIDIVLARGEVFDGRKPRIVRGEPSSCHENAALHHLLSRGRLQICRGFGLSGDGLWRHHSWLLDGKRVLETTVKRRVYFGFRLDPVQTAKHVLGEVLPLLPGVDRLFERAEVAA